MLQSNTPLFVNEPKLIASNMRVSPIVFRDDKSG